jgi:hypothetical protein
METKGWENVVAFLEKNWNIKPGLNGVLFLIGMQVIDIKRTKFNKEEKQDLMHIAICAILSKDGYYKYVSKDKDGWPHYKLIKKLPEMPVEQQEAFLKEKVVEYFEQGNLI